MIQKIKRATLLTAQDMNHQAAFEIEKLPKIIVEQLEVAKKFSIRCRALYKSLS